MKIANNFLFCLFFSFPAASLANPIATQQEILLKLMESDSVQTPVETLPQRGLPADIIKSIDSDQDITLIAKEDNANYIGLRLMNLVKGEAKISPAPNALAKEFRECDFARDEMITTFANDCIIKDAAPSYKLGTDESFRIIAITPRCCLASVKISSNQSANNRTLNLFNGLKGVEVRPANCKNLEGQDARGVKNEFFTIHQYGQAKFSIQQSSIDDSSGNSTSTTIYFGQPDIDCNLVADSNKRYADTEIELNRQRLAQQSLPPPRVLKSPNQLLSELTQQERLLADDYKTLYFCAGFQKDIWPNASRDHCKASGNVNKSKCEAYMTDWFFKDINSSSNQKSSLFIEFLNQNQDNYFGQYARGRNVSKNRHIFSDEWFNAVSVCQNYVNRIRPSFKPK